MRKRGAGFSKKESKWGGKGAGMKKHAKSGVPTNHANSIARTREVNAELKKEAERRERLRLKFLKENTKKSL